MHKILVATEVRIITTLLEYITEHNIHTLDNFLIHNIKDGLIYTSDEFMKDYLYQYIDNHRVDFKDEDLHNEIINNPNRKYNNKRNYVKLIIYDVFIYLIRNKSLILDEYLQDYVNDIIEIENLSFEITIL